MGGTVAPRREFGGVAAAVAALPQVSGSHEAGSGRCESVAIGLPSAESKAQLRIVDPY